MDAVKQTTCANFVVQDGHVVLVVHELTDDKRVIEHAFDVDTYALALATRAVAAVNERAAMSEA